jgi:hypothetical protein
LSRIKVKGTYAFVQTDGQTYTQTDRDSHVLDLSQTEGYVFFRSLCAGFPRDVLISAKKNSVRKREKGEKVKKLVVKSK